VDESKSGAGAGVLHTYFEYDALNRLTAYKTKQRLFRTRLAGAAARPTGTAGKDACPTGTAARPT
jgi:hypothetical protein